MTRLCCGFVLSVPVFAGYIVLRNLARSDLRHVSVLGVFHSVHSVRFEGIALFDYFLDTFGVGIGDVWDLLNVTGLPSRARAQLIWFPFIFLCHGFAPYIARYQVYWFLNLPSLVFTYRSNVR